MLGSTDKVKVLALNLVHHSVHFRKAHNAGYNVRANHKRGYAVGKSPVNHKISCVGDYRGVQSCDIAHQVVEAVARNTSCAVKVKTVKALHNLAVVGHLEIGNDRLAVALYLNVLAVVLAYRNRWVNDVRNGHHNLRQFLVKLGFFLVERFHLVSELLNLRLCLFSLVLLALCHVHSYFLGNTVSVGAERFYCLLCAAKLGVKLDCLVNQRELCVLKLLLDVFLYNIGVFS